MWSNKKEYGQSVHEVKHGVLSYVIARLLHYRQYGMKRTTFDAIYIRPLLLSIQRSVAAGPLTIGLALATL